MPRSRVMGVRKQRTAAEGSYHALMWQKIWRERWADPEYRAYRLAEMAKGGKFAHHGIIWGLTRAECAILRADAERWVNNWMKDLEKAGIVLPDGQIIPESDDAIAKASLREAAILALSPGSKKDKLQALTLCLAYTKSKPVAKTEFSMKKPEDWLAEVVADAKANDTATT